MKREASETQGDTGPPASQIREDELEGHEAIKYVRQSQKVGHSFIQDQSRAENVYGYHGNTKGSEKILNGHAGMQEQKKKEDGVFV